MRSSGGSALNGTAIRPAGGFAVNRVFEVDSRAGDALCLNSNCPLHQTCRRYEPGQPGFATLFRPERRRDNQVWCQMFQEKHK